ncbi:MAG: aldose 1-epimerase family protein [Candidatus Latescibacterota bacterium]
MPNLFGTYLTKGELLRRVGDISQIAGVQCAQGTEGNERGVQAVHFKTGTGFRFTVLPSRGMDLSLAEHCGRPLCWRSSTGDVGPSFFEPEHYGWLRSFSGGLVTTCGLSNVGAPCTDQGEDLGLHGRIAHTPAKHVYVDGKWVDDEYIMWAQGTMRETRVFGENLELTRKVWAKLGENRLFIEDTVENIGFDPTPLMILYHINGGYPAVDEGSRLVSPTTSVTPRDADAEVGLADYAVFQKPTPGFKEWVYSHEMKADKKGRVHAALINHGFDNGAGFGFYVAYQKEALGHFTEWKMNGEGTYVVGMEPANCEVDGRAEVREKGALEFINPGEQKRFELEIGVLDSKEQIAAFEEKVRTCR